MELDIRQSHVLVTPRSFGQDDQEMIRELEASVQKVTLNETGRPLTEEELLELIPDVDGYIAGLDPISEKVIQAGKKLRVISRYGVGVDNVDLEAAREKGVTVTNTPGANSVSVAELTIGLMMCLARNLVPAVQATKSGQWPRIRGWTLSGKTVGLIGLGDIGQAVAVRLRCFGCHVMAFDVSPDQQFATENQITLASMDEILLAADILSLHCSLVPDTETLINREKLEKINPGTFLINTARGELVDEQALLWALEEQILAGAALDVFSNQPPDPENPLLTHPRVLTTPHMGAHTDDAKLNMGWGSLRNCLAVLEGREPPNRII